MEFALAFAAILVAALRDVGMYLLALLVHDPGRPDRKGSAARKKLLGGITVASVDAKISQFRCNADSK